MARITPRRGRARSKCTTRLPAARFGPHSVSSPAVPPQHHTTRLAPSPTGALHLGNARTFLINWALARQNNWSILLRIEDLDGPRIRPGAIESTIETLRWLGLDWDTGPIVQSHDLAPYREAMSSLAARALAYPSDLSRAQIESKLEEQAAADLALSAPQEGATESFFPPTLRPPLTPRPFENENTNWRFATPPGPVHFHDHFKGPQHLTPAQTIGDFLIWTRRAQPAYQLAVVVDDHRQHITHIVRGDDLLDSAARQLLLYRALNQTPEPSYTHLPLVRGPDGRRLAKRHGDTRIDHYRSRGTRPEQIIGLIAHWCGIFPAPAPLSAPEFRAALRLDTIPRSDIVFTRESDAWLLANP
jgi:glutamyl-tRNA synthetase